MQEDQKPYRESKELNVREGGDCTVEAVKYSTQEIKQNILMWLQLVLIYILFHLYKAHIQICHISVLSALEL